MRSFVSTLVARTAASCALRRPWPVFVVLCWCVASVAAAQSALTGIVHDPSERVAVGATVVVFDRSGTQQWETQTSPIGYYEIELPPGEYRVQAYLDQLTYKGTVLVFPNEKAAYDITLEFLREERETVQGGGSQSETLTTQGALGATFSRTAIDTLPLSNGRTLQSFLSLVPGIIFTDSVGTLAQFTAVGQRRFSNRFNLDGVSADVGIDVKNVGITPAMSGALPAVSTLGGTQTLVPQAAIEDIQIHTSVTTAEQGRSPGAQTFVITRSGADQFTGAAFVDARPSQLNASDWFAKGSYSEKHAPHYANGGISSGGPIAKRRLFYFAAWESQAISRPVTTTTIVPSMDYRESAPPDGRRVLDSFPIPNGKDLGQGQAQFVNEFPAASSLSSVSLRLDGNLSPRNRFFARLNVGRSRGDALDALQVPQVSFDSQERASATNLTTGLTSELPWGLNELRLSTVLNRGSSIASASPFAAGATLPLDLLVPTARSGNASVAVGLFSGPGGSLLDGSVGASSQRQIEVADTLSVVRGRHEWRLGFDGRWRTSLADAAQSQYLYRFNTADLLQGHARSLTDLEVAPARARFRSLSAFIQDAFRVSGRLSLQYGLRYSVEPAPTSGNDLQPLLLAIEKLPQAQTLAAGSPLWSTSWSNVAPHLSATYQLATAANRETTLRAGWSLLFDELTDPGATAFGGGYPYVTTRFVTSPGFPVPENVLTAPAPQPFSTLDRASYFAFSKDLRTPRTSMWQVGIDQALGGRQRLGIAYVGALGRDLLYRYQYALPDTTAAQAIAYTNAASSNYQALLAEYVWRLSYGLQARVAYTWSHAIDLDSGEALLPNAPPELIAPSTNRGAADFDRRHILQALVTYQVPAPRTRGRLRFLLEDWQLDANVAARSGAPITVFAARDIGSGTINLRPDLVPGVPLWISDRSAPGGQKLNPAAFSIQTDLDVPELRQGTLGRNSIRAFPLNQINLTLSRSVRLGERATVRFRLDAYNVFNIPNFGPPLSNRDAPDASFGLAYQSYANALGTGTLSGGGLTPVQQSGGPRSIQFGARFSF
jgi:hypothetical protein